jgi:hypothetical protein
MGQRHLLGALHFQVGRLHNMDSRVPVLLYVKNGFFVFRDCFGLTALCDLLANAERSVGRAAENRQMEVNS